MKGLRVKKILYTGWIAPEYNLYSLFNRRRINAVVCESPNVHISMRGLRGVIKKMIISRMSTALVSGIAQKAFFERQGFKGEILVTGSVGIFDKATCVRHGASASQRRYLYVGRLTPVKNIGMLVEAFNRLGYPLTIVGKGELMEGLRSQAKDNIRFVGYVPNKHLKAVYAGHDVLVLPSKKEAWGLVVEEALYRGLPVIVSDGVGCVTDLVTYYASGIIFRTGDLKSLVAAVRQMEKEFIQLQSNTRNINWEERENGQIDAYLKTL